MASERASVQNRIFHIRIKGNLDEKWADWFEGFVMASRGNGETLLSGEVVDQSALHGVLAKIHRLGLPLLLVAETGCPCSKQKCPRHGQCHECAAYHIQEGKLPYCFRPGTRWDKRYTALTQAG